MLKIKVFIQDKFIKSKDFSPDMLIAYIGLRTIIMKDKNEYYVSIGLLSYSIFGKQVASQMVTKSIMNGIKQLIEKDIIVHIDKKFKTRSNEYILDLSKLQIEKVKSKNEKDFYTSVDLDYIIKILDSNIKEKMDLLLFYCYLTTTMSKSGDKVGVGFTSYTNMASATGICRQTISKYMDTLEKKKIIHIYRSTDAVLKNGMITEIPNTYGDFVNQAKVISVGSTYEGNYGENAKRIKSTKKSSSRSASAKYNIICNDLLTTGELRYSKEEVKDIYETLVQHNKRYEYDESLQKDLSIFEVFGFIDT